MTFEEWCRSYNSWMDGPDGDVVIYTNDPALNTLWKERQKKIDRLESDLKEYQYLADTHIDIIDANNCIIEDLSEQLKEAALLVKEGRALHRGDGCEKCGFMDRSKEFLNKLEDK